MKRWEYRIWTKVIIPLEGWGWRAALALAFLAFSVSRLHADDSLFVHDLAHAAGGGMVATASDAFMDALKPVPWYTRLAVNVGMVIGLMPVTGIPLPLMSYGGSSVLFTFLALGVAMNVRMRRFVN